MLTETPRSRYAKDQMLSVALPHLPQQMTEMRSPRLTRRHDQQFRDLQLQRISQQQDQHLADEVRGGDIMSIFTDLWQQGRTIVIITPDPALSRRASRVVEIHDGRITPDQATNAAA